MKLLGHDSMTRADLHVHSTASEESKLGVQRALGLPECATPPEEVHELAKRRGMDFVTITDHDTIAGALQIADRPDVFVSEELTASFAGEPQQVHVLCYGITPDDHAQLQELAADVEAVAEYLHEREIACALAHPFYAVAAPLAARHRRRLAELFPIWEVRNGSRAAELNLPAAIYIDTHGGTGIGGSDDHAGVDVGRTWTEAPAAATPEEFLAHLRAGRVDAPATRGRRRSGRTPRWRSPSARSVAARARRAVDPAAVLKMVERVVTQGDARTGALAGDLGPEDARALLRAWLGSIGLGLSDAELLAWLQSDDFSHADLRRRARRLARAQAAGRGRTGARRRDRHERRLGPGAAEPVRGLRPGRPLHARRPRSSGARSRSSRAAARSRCASRSSPTRSAACTASPTRWTRSASAASPGFEVEVIGTDMKVDRRLSAVAEVDIPFYAGLKVGVPSPLAVVEAIAEGRYGLVHLCSPGPAGAAAAMTARILELPLAGSYHTELAAYARLRSGDGALELAVQAALGAFYGACDVVLSPSAASDARLGELGVAPEQDRALRPRRRHRALRPGAARARPLRRARRPHPRALRRAADDREGRRPAGRRVPRRPRARPAPAPAAGRRRARRRTRLRERLGDAATFLGWLDGDELATTYASADLLLFCSETDTFGQVLLEAQASGLPVVAVRAGGPAELIRSGWSGLLCPPEARALGAAVARLAGDPEQRARLAHGGLAAVRERTWDAALGRLAAGWRRALVPGAVDPVRRAA